MKFWYLENDNESGSRNLYPSSWLAFVAANRSVGWSNESRHLLFWRAERRRPSRSGLLSWPHWAWTMRSVILIYDFEIFNWSWLFGCSLHMKLYSPLEHLKINEIYKNIKLKKIWFNLYFQCIFNNSSVFWWYITIIVMWHSIFNKNLSFILTYYVLI